MIALISVPGTGGAPMFESDAGPILTDPMLDVLEQFRGKPYGRKWVWYLISYLASVFPMGPSWRDAIEKVVWVLLHVYPIGPGFYFVLDGYSQGAIVVAHVWRDEILSPRGRLHHLLPYCLGVITYGPPCRAPGVAYGNTELWGHPAPSQLDGFTTGGIAGPDDLRPEQCVFPKGHPLEGQPAVFDHVNEGDLYGDCPVGDDPWHTETGVGHDERLVYEIVQDFNGQNIAAMLTEALSTLGVVAVGGVFNLNTLITVGMAAVSGITGSRGIPGLPILGAQTPDHVASMLLALLNGGLFALHGFGPHGAYDSGPAIDYLARLGEQYAGV